MGARAATQASAPGETVRALEIHWVVQLPTPYNDELFRALAAQSGVELTLHYMDRALAEWPWKAPLGNGYPHRFYRRLLGIDWALVRAALRGGPRFFILGAWHEPTAALLLLLLGAIGRPFSIWCDTPDLDRRRGALKRTVRNVWLRWVFSRASCVMGTGKLALRHLHIMGCPGEKLVDLPCVIDTQSFPSALRTAPREGEPLVFLSTGRLVAYKGYGRAIRALAAAARRSGLSFHYALAGTGSEEASLRRIAAEEGVADRVEFAGWLEPEEIQRFLLRGHFLLHPASFEAYGVTVIEALASGLPVIGSDLVGAVVDRVVDGENGFVHRASDDESLTQQILRAAARAGEIEKMSAAAIRSGRSWSPERAARLVKERAAAATRR